MGNAPEEGLCGEDRGPEASLSGAGALAVLLVAALLATALGCWPLLWLVTLEGTLRAPRARFPFGDAVRALWLASVPAALVCGVCFRTLREGPSLPFLWTPPWSAAASSIAFLLWLGAFAVRRRAAPWPAEGPGASRHRSGGEAGHEAWAKRGRLGGCRPRRPEQPTASRPKPAR
ncbi:MAG: hypothetical protein D6731_15670 [Planctomycetota bacterium]|nr:MAG: hypothetical protein D6731_15670 [Planctomycetota bacterium]